MSEVDRWEEPEHRNGKLNLSDYTPEEIARRMLETPPPPEKQVAKAASKRRREEKRTKTA
jgi:hypothetical protein